MFGQDLNMRHKKKNIDISEHADLRLVESKQWSGSAGTTAKYHYSPYNEQATCECM